MSMHRQGKPLQRCVIVYSPDSHCVQVLYDKCVEDASLGRMTLPRELTEEDVEKFNLAPRFSVVQGEGLLS